jgi:hypothetical protein
MNLDGDKEALRLYKAGDRTSDRVVAYYKREGLGRAAKGTAGIHRTVFKLVCAAVK